jgi:tetratricopeptide (TPR) repeat protein
VRRREFLFSPAALAAAPQPRFSDVTAAVFGGTASFREQLSKGVPYWRARMDVACGIDVYGSQGIAVGDIDNDGRDEAYVCQPGGLPNRLYRFGSDGVAVDITERSRAGILDDTSSALFVDTRNRGVQDLIVLRSGGPLLFRGNGDGTFSLDRGAFRFAREPQGSFTGMAAADYDGDGFVDLYLCSYIYFQSAEQYRYPTPYHDARNGPPNFLFRNRDGVFDDVTGDSGIDENNNRYSFAAAWCDYDRDGRQELYVANDFGRNNLYKFDGTKFRDIAAEAGVEDIGPGMSAAWFDAHGAGRFDLYVANMWTPIGQRVVKEAKLEPADAYRRHAKGNTLYRNLGNGKFAETGQAEMGRWAWSADACDFDYDGAPEIYIACGMITGDRPDDAMQFFWENVVAKTGKEYEEGWNTMNQRIREGDSWAGHEPNVFYTLDRGKAADRSAESGIAFADDSRAFAFTDFDGDGFVDMILKSRLGPQVRALRNERGAGRDAVGIRLQGTKSNRDAIGAIVEFGGQIKQVSAGSGYLSQHSKTLYFAGAAAEATVDWPSGLRQRIDGLAPGFAFTVVEGGEIRRRPFAKRPPLSAAKTVGDNSTDAASFRLIDPIPVASPQILGRYLRDLRRELPESATWRRDSNNFLTDIQIGPHRALAATPFSGEYVTPPARNLLKLATAFYLHKDLRGALVYSYAASERTPENSAAWRAIGGIHLELKQPDLAIPALDRTFALSPSADFADETGLRLAELGRPADAKKWFQRAIELDRKHASAINNLGVLYGEQGQWNDAASAFEYGLSVAPEDDRLYLNLGRVYLRQGEREKAKLLMERWLERKPGNAAARRALEELLR